MRKNIEEIELTRRAFFKRSFGIATGVAAMTALIPGLKETGELIADSVENNSANATLTMYNDLNKALQKPIEQRKWAMVIDIRKCIGCNACTAACIAENNLPVGVTYRTVAEVEDGEFPTVRRFFMPGNCMQCENAPCIEAANKIIPGAMSRRPDGIVVIDYKKMKGKKVFEAASDACPYPNSLWFDEGKNYTDGTPAVQPYEKRKAKEYGKEWSRAETKGTTRKCHFCTQRIDAGMLPACVATCTGQAMHFGDLNDSDSLVSKLLKKEKSARLNLAAGTEPRVYYLDDDPEQTCMVCHS
jgi:tetrathionate reductase subunit B